MKHTKGEWIFIHENVFAPDENNKGDFKHIATVIDINNGEFHANTKLIAAAPDLLLACMVAKEEMVLGGDWKAAKKKLESAIKKATT